ncbi:MAG TPA: hypothetical protein VFV99_22150 [Kofleriaceae bacterium]|nr:hypothetical protein [Kofleriaceae bacterium]
MRAFLFAALVVAACGSDKSTTPSKATPAPTPVVAPTQPAAAPKVAQQEKPAAKSESSVASAEKPTQPMAGPPPGGHDFTAEGRALFIVGACGEGTSEEANAVPAARRKQHCDVVNKAQSDYADKWVKKAHAFFVDKVPKDAPKTVVYPFAGGDLSTALTVYPDATEITTLSLEPAGDPRTLAALKGNDLDEAMHKVEFELKWLYRVNFSNTLNMIDAMRGGHLPTQLIFGLSALKVHGYELVSLRYFSIQDDGSIHYLDDADIAKAPAPTAAKSAQERNMVFANAEVQFKKQGGGEIQVWRHIRANLGNETSKGIGKGLKDDPRVLKHLEAKGKIAGMTKAASYLLSWDSFSLMRNYLVDHVVWMVSDATGVAPKWGKKAGFEYETYGTFEAPHIDAGNGISTDWKQEFAAEPKRSLAFRFGYYDKKFRNHLVIMKKKA